MQLSLLPNLEAPVRQAAPIRVRPDMVPGSRPTEAQVRYLKKLAKIRTDTQLARYVARRVGKDGPGSEAYVLTRQDFARAIDLELEERVRTS